MTTAGLVRAIHRAACASAKAEDRPIALLWHGIVWAWLTMRLERRLRGVQRAEIEVREGGWLIRARFYGGIVDVSPVRAAA